jgi:LmbE family N-acetylglucosaminyl deacetylase
MSTQFRQLVRPFTRAVIFPLVQGIWTAAFALLGTIIRPRLTEIRPTGSDRVLVVAPHPDDETLGCGLAIVAHSKAGDAVAVFVITDGRRSRAGGLGQDEIRLLRQKEARRAIAALGATAELFDFPEGEWRVDALASALHRRLAQFRPTIVYAPSTIDFHPEHRRVAVELARSGLQDVEFRMYEVQVPLTPLLANSYVTGDRSAHRLKRAALANYRSQRPSFLWLARREIYNSIVYGTSRTIEVFASVTPQAYAAIITTTAGNTFHGMRPRPLTDPLAWIVGLRARHRAASFRPPQN